MRTVLFRIFIAVIAIKAGVLEVRAQTLQDIARLEQTCSQVLTTPHCKIPAGSLAALATQVNSCDVRLKGAGCTDFFQRHPNLKNHEARCDVKDICRLHDSRTLVEGCREAGIEVATAMTGDCKKGAFQGVCIGGNVIWDGLKSLWDYGRGPLFGGRALASDLYSGTKKTADYGLHLSCVDAVTQSKLICYAGVSAGLILVAKGAASLRYAALAEEIEGGEVASAVKPVTAPKPSLVERLRGKIPNYSKASREVRELADDVATRRPSQKPHKIEIGSDGKARVTIGDLTKNDFGFSSKLLQAIKAGQVASIEAGDVIGPQAIKLLESLKKVAPPGRPLIVKGEFRVEQLEENLEMYASNWRDRGWRGPETMSPAEVRQYQQSVRSLGIEAECSRLGFALESCGSLHFQFDARNPVGSMRWISHSSDY